LLTFSLWRLTAGSDSPINFPVKVLERLAIAPREIALKGTAAKFEDSAPPVLGADGEALALLLVAVGVALKGAGAVGLLLSEILQQALGGGGGGQVAQILLPCGLLFERLLDGIESAAKGLPDSLPDFG
jgi:hypothetical protein